MFFYLAIKQNSISSSSSSSSTSSSSSSSSSSDSTDHSSSHKTLSAVAITSVCTNTTNNSANNNASLKQQQHQQQQQHPSGVTPVMASNNRIPSSKSNMGSLAGLTPAQRTQNAANCNETNSISFTHTNIHTIIYVWCVYIVDHIRMTMIYFLNNTLTSTEFTQKINFKDCQVSDYLKIQNFKNKLRSKICKKNI